MPGQTLLQSTPEQNKYRGHGQVNNRGPEVHRQIEGLGKDPPGLPHHVQHGNHADHRTALQQQNDFVAQGREGNAIGIRQDDLFILLKLQQGMDVIQEQEIQ